MSAITSARGYGARRSIFGYIASTLDMFAAAQECSEAVRHGRRPASSSLQTLGISDASFDQIKFRR